MASRSATRAKPPHKVEYIERVDKLLSKYHRILVVEADNVLSDQMHQVRLALRGKGEIVMGKNSLMRKVFSKRIENDDNTTNQALVDAFVNGGLLLGNVGLVLTNEPLDAILEVLSRFKVQAAARVGATAPIEVTIPSGMTGLEPTQTQFFMALNIQTKIEKGQVSIVKDVVVLRPGDRVGSSEAKLLLKMKLKPFMYGLETKYVYEDGVVFPRSVVGLSDSFLLEATQGAVDDVAALSLVTGIQTAPSLAHEVLGGVKDILALAFATGLTFSEFGADTFIDAVLSGKVVAAAPAAASAAPAAKAAAVAAPKEEEEEAADFGLDLF